MATIDLQCLECAASSQGYRCHNLLSLLLALEELIGAMGLVDLDELEVVAVMMAIEAGDTGPISSSWCRDM